MSRTSTRCNTFEISGKSITLDRVDDLNEATGEEKVVYYHLRTWGRLGELNLSKTFFTGDYANDTLAFFESHKAFFVKSEETFEQEKAA